MRIKTLLIPTFFLLGLLACNAQLLEFQWLGTGTGQAGAGCSAVKIDWARNVYIAGDYDSPDLAFGKIKLPKYTVQRDVYVAKFNAEGKVVWAAKGASVQSESITGMDVDHMGNVYVCGYSYGKELSFGTAKVVSQSGARLGFLAKYDSTGNVMWVKAGEGGEYNGVAIGPDDNPVITGWFMGERFKVGNQILTNEFPGQRELVVAKFNGAGDVVWATSAGGYASEIGNAVACDSNGDIFVAGEFGSPTVQFGKNEQTQITMGIRRLKVL
jgi:hypothetical protein